MNYFYLLEWSDAVLDIREQFPLNREDTLSIAGNKGIKHSIDPKTNVPIVMTTDFVITVSASAGKVQIARTIKPSNELENKRTIDKFEIERAYWESRGVSWGIVTEKEMPMTVIENIEWLHSSYYDIEHMSIASLEKYIQLMKPFLNRQNTSIIDVVTEFDAKFHLESGMALEILKHMMARREVQVNLNQKIYTHLYLEDVFKTEGMKEGL